MRIDAHVHFWQIEHYDSWWMTGELAALKIDRRPEDLAPCMAAARMDGAVFVQAQHAKRDNDWVLRLTRSHDWIRGVVGWVDLTAADVEDQVAELQRHPRFCGVRHIVQDEPEVDWILREDVDAGLAALARRGVTYDLLFKLPQLAHATTVAERHPELRLVLDHLSKPRIAARSIDDWLPHFRAAARHPNLYCKLSGLVTEADWRSWTIDDLRPYVDHALAAFGPSRLMVGSDWPVCTLASSYERVIESFETLLSALSPSEQARIFGGTAREAYRLHPGSAA